MKVLSELELPTALIASHLIFLPFISGAIESIENIWVGLLKTTPSLNHLKKYFMNRIQILYKTFRKVPAYVLLTVYLKYICYKMRCKTSCFVNLGTLCALCSTVVLEQLLYRMFAEYGYNK